MNKNYYNIIDNNTVNNNVNGIEIDTSFNNIVSNNTCYFNTEEGIYIGFADKNKISTLVTNIPDLSILRQYITIVYNRYTKTAE